MTANPLLRFSIVFIVMVGCMLALPLRTATAQQGTSLEEAQQFYQAEQYDQAAAAAAALAKEDASNQPAWLLWGASLRQMKRFEEAAGVYEQLVETGTAPPFVPYVAGLSHAQAGDLDAAFEWLNRSIDGGFGNFQQLQTDSSFAALRADARYAALEEKADRLARPCVYSEKHHEFDFWIGEWDVVNPQGQPAGTNSIQPAEEHCVLIERWTGGGGGTGMSINYYDPAKDKWVQQWIARGGSVLYIEGGLNEDGEMVLVGTSTNLQGQETLTRGIWTLLPDGRVRQRFEQSNDDGATWTLSFDGYYARRD